jgi:hypothetical protein
VIGERSFVSIARKHHTDADVAARAIVRELRRTGRLSLDEIEELIEADSKCQEREREG